MKAQKRQSGKNHWGNFWSGKKNASEYYSNQERVIQNLSQATIVQGKWILEIGAGTGRDGLQLVSKGARVILLDYSDQSLSMIKQNLKPHIQNVYLIKGDALNLPIREKSLDVVFHQGLLEHFHNPNPLLRENFRVLRNGGLCLADVPQKFHIYTVIKHLCILFNVWFAGWETEFTVRGLIRLMQNTGFRIRTVYGDWMRPSLGYRMIRACLMRIGIPLPMYPRGFKTIRSLRKSLRQRINRFRWSLNTCLDIGVVAEKPKPLEYEIPNSSY